MLLKSETRSSTVRVCEAKNLKNTCFLLALRCGPFSNLNKFFFHAVGQQLRCCAARSARGAAASRQQARLRLAIFYHFSRARLYMMQMSRIKVNISLLFTIFYVRNNIFQNNYCELSGAARAVKMKKVARTRASAFFPLEVPQRLQIVHR